MKLFKNAMLVLPTGIIENGFVLEADGVIKELGSIEGADEVIKELGSIEGADGVIKELGCIQEAGEGILPSCEVIDCGGLYLSPGFIDLHTHGGGGHDYMDGTVEAFIGAVRAHLQHGTTTLLPTTLTSSDADLFAAIDGFQEARKIKEDMPELLGLHLEGPYFNLLEKGAQNPDYLRHPTPEHYERILEYAGGAIRRWSLAPELPGSMEMIRRLSGQGILLSAGHTAAELDIMKEAFSYGLHHLTHFYSGMSTIHRKNGMRIMGVVESGYLLDGMNVELIADGMHLPPDLLRLILKCKNHDEICLCTDSMRGAGMPQGPSILGSLREGIPVIIEGGIAYMPDKTCFAGSVATTDLLVRVMVKEAGLSIWEAVRMISHNPAVLMGCEKEKGTLEQGKDADLVLFDTDIRVQAVYVKGQQVKYLKTSV